MLVNVFNSLYFVVNIPVIPTHFYYFIFCFKFYYPIVDMIVSHLYLLFVHSRKTKAKCYNKKGKKQRYHLGAASKICGKKYCCI